MRISPFVFICLLALAITACKENEKKSNDKFPVHSFIQSQVAMADSSLLPLRLITNTTDSTKDTLYFERSQFRKYAEEFLSLPDLTDAAYDNRFTETSTYDPDLNRLIIYQLPVNAEKEFIQRQELLVEPNVSNNQIKTVIVNTAAISKDSAIEKRMIWNVNESFQVTKIKQVAGEEEEITTYRVEWNINE